MDETEYDRVFVAGASGATGKAVLELLGPRSPTVRALTRSSDTGTELRRAGADEVVVDDLLAPDDLDGALEGVNAVISAVGSSPLTVWTADRLVDGDGVQTLLDAAVAADVEAFVMESALGVGDDPASPLGSLFDVAIGPVQRAKAASEQAIRSAPIRHTIFRPGVLTNGQRTDTVTVAEPGAKLYGLVSRADVARLLVAAPLTEAAADSTFEVVSTPQFPDRRLAIDWRLPGERDG
jgi:nucleoside-diphosphate-sugar epimerase